MTKKFVAPVLYFSLIALLSSYTCIFCKKQGIKGHVYRISGNQMPSPDIKPAPLKGIKTTIYIYELTNTSQVQKADRAAFYTSIPTQLVKTVESDKKGRFKVKLLPGQYSLFTKTGDLYYANLFDDKGNIAPVTIEKGKFTEMDIRIDYDAVY